LVFQNVAKAFAALLPQICGDLCYATAAIMRRFIWEDSGWPDLTVNEAALEPDLTPIAYRAGRVAEVLFQLGRDEQRRVRFDTLTDTAIETSAIEGETLSIASVRASLARRLDMPFADDAPTDARAEGVVAVTVDAVQHAERELTQARLHHWHALIFPDPDPQLTVGTWRSRPDDSMQVISHAERLRPTIHFEAPPGPSVSGEMNRFLDWFASPGPAPMQRPLIHAAVAHLWFVTIHPYGDGNGRIGRAIADLALARHDPEIADYVSLSRQIRTDRKSYYDALERAQGGPLDVTPWVSWFANCYGRAVDHTLTVGREMIQARSFWTDHANATINDRQRVVLQRYLSGAFEGWINTSKYATLAKTSPDTAQRDIAALVAQKILVPNGSRGPRTSYRLTDTYDPQIRRGVETP
jgi:Fic family protein